MKCQNMYVLQIEKYLTIYYIKYNYSRICINKVYVQEFK